MDLLVRLQHGAIALAAMPQKGKWRMEEPVTPVREPMPSNCQVIGDERIEKIARMCHEVNRLYCQTVGDDTQPAWEDASERQKDSVRDGVRFMVNHMWSGPEGNHNNWMACKLRDGWRYGEVKDAVEKTHPCLLPFEFLTGEQRVKDSLFVSIVRSLIGAQ